MCYLFQLFCKTISVKMRNLKIFIQDQNLLQNYITFYAIFDVTSQN